MNDDDASCVLMLVDSSDVQPAAGTYFMKLSWERAVIGLCLHVCQRSLLALSPEVVNCKAEEVVV